MAAAMGFTGGLLGCGSSTTQSQADEAEALPGRPYHHTADGFRNPPGSPAHEHDLSNWAGIYGPIS